MSGEQSGGAGALTCRAACAVCPPPSTRWCRGSAPCNVETFQAARRQAIKPRTQRLLLREDRQAARFHRRGQHGASDLLHLPRRLRQPVVALCGSNGRRQRRPRGEMGWAERCCAYYASLVSPPDMDSNALSGAAEVCVWEGESREGGLEFTKPPLSPPDSVSAQVKTRNETCGLPSLKK